MICKTALFVFLAAAGCFFSAPVHAQTQSRVMVHSHNDYQQPIPLWNALRHRADFIEIDVFPVNGQLLVAHSRDELKTAPSLESLYLQPLQRLLLDKDTSVVFGKYGRFSLFIDIKEGPTLVFPLLYQLMQQYPAISQAGIKIVISGDRGPISAWRNAPPYICFDGRPTENYDSITLPRVAMISDSYRNHRGRSASGDPDVAGFVRHANRLGKPARLWGAPDEPEKWQWLVTQGVTILNTDTIELLRKMFP